MAPVSGTAKIAFGRIKCGLKAKRKQVNHTDMTITIGNGAVLRSSRPRSRTTFMGRMSGPA